MKIEICLLKPRSKIEIITLKMFGTVVITLRLLKSPKLQSSNSDNELRHFNDLSSLSCQMAGREGLAYSLAAGYTSVTMTCVSVLETLSLVPASLHESAIVKELWRNRQGDGPMDLPGREEGSPQLATPSSAVRVNLLLSYFASVFVVIFRLYRASTSSRLYIRKGLVCFTDGNEIAPREWFVKSRLRVKHWRMSAEQLLYRAIHPSPAVVRSVDSEPNLQRAPLKSTLMPMIVELSMGTSRRVSGRDGQAHPRARGGLPARHVYIQVELPPQVSDHRPDIIESRRDESGDTRPETSPAGNITLDKGGKLTRVASPSRRCLIDLPSLTSKFLETSSWRIAPTSMISKFLATSSW
ncbi:hypothetical protein J6590_013791 [Homalodisca vitripennis]|nr:hypothetical protein J6590_013791 [Homalodisca vitripennis]